MDYYSILGVSKNSSQQDIKKAYRSLAHKHHPDKGGDATRFQQVKEAYEVLSDPHKKQMYDHGVDPNRQQQGGFRRGPFEFHFGDNPEDIFSQFGFGFGGPQRQRRNKSYNITVQITLEDVLNGKDISAQVRDERGNNRLVNIQVPPGIEEGQQIKYAGMGDDSIPNMPPGDLIVNISVAPHKSFERRNNDLVTEVNVSVWDALLGGKVKVKTLDGRDLNINVPQGTQPGTVLSCREEGLPNVRTKRRGNLLVIIKIDIPKNLSKKQRKIISRIRDGI